MAGAMSLSYFTVKLNSSARRCSTQDEEEYILAKKIFRYENLKVRNQVINVVFQRLGVSHSPVVKFMKYRVMCDVVIISSSWIFSRSTRGKPGAPVFIYPSLCRKPR